MRTVKLMNHSLVIYYWQVCEIVLQLQLQLYYLKWNGQLLSVYYWTISNWLMICGRWLTQKRARAGFAKCSRSFQLISLISFPAPIIIPANQCNRILQMPNHCHRLALMDFPNQVEMWPTLAQNLRYVATYISGSAVNPS